MKKTILCLLTIIISGALSAQVVRVGSSPEYVKALTSRWQGERFADGRPKVSDESLELLQSCTLEEIWAYLGGKGYINQVEKNWLILKPGETLVGRVVTAQYMPKRPDLDTLIRETGTAEKRTGGTNTWPIDVLTKGDIYVADGYGKIEYGTLIGSSLGNAIYGKTGKGVIFYGSIRDMQELKATKGFNAWVKGEDPSAIRDMVNTSINAPIRIGPVTVFPGDVVFANDYGVVFIPAYLMSGLLSAAQMASLKDEYERLLLSSGKYPASQIHGKWVEQIKTDFRAWVAKYPKKLIVTPKEVDAFLAASK